MQTIKALSKNATQKEFEHRLKEIINNQKLKYRKERISELSKMYIPKGYYIPEKLIKELIKQSLI